MKNLFDYATKELSQDAFIQWFINNYDDEDYGIKDISSSFVNFLMDKNNKSPISEKAIIETRSQVNHMDIVVDVYYDDAKTIHDVIVIEDKTFSSEHKQLTKYNDVIKGWPNIRNVYKVFYKIGSLTSHDEEGLKAANKDQETQWRVYDINTIWDFFKDKGNTKSQLLNDYVRYVVGIKESLDGNEIGNDIADWKFYKWEGYVKKYLSNYDDPNNDRYLWLSSYQGKYVSICYQKCLPNSLDAAVIEITVRGNKLHTIFHHSFYDGPTESRKWAVNEVKNERQSNCEELRKKLIKYALYVSELDETIQQVDSKKAFKCFGKFADDKEANNKDELTTMIKNWIDKFIDFIDKFHG